MVRLVAAFKLFWKTKELDRREAVLSCLSFAE